MFTIKLNSVDINIVALYIQNEFQKFIKITDTDILNLILTRFLKEINYPGFERLEHLKAGVQLNLDISKSQIKELKNLILIGPDYELIELPHGLQRSVEFNRPILITHRNLTEFIAYWKLPVAESLKFQLFQCLSEDIIEVPYVDTPLEYDMRWNKFAFRPNHGSTHSIRLVQLLNTALKITQVIAVELSDPNVPNPVLTLTDEEKSCLELALFLYRSGRTNEMGWSSDPSYSKRSAEIFRIIALKLGYHSNLVNVIVSSFDYKSPVPMANDFFEPLTEDNRMKIGLFKQLFKLVHNADLIRCFTNFEDISKNVKSVFYKLLGPIDDGLVNEVTHQFLVIAAKYCKQTGSPIVVQELQLESTGTFFGNKYAMVKVVADVKGAFIDLGSIDLDWDVLFSVKNKPKLVDASELQVNADCSSSSEIKESIRLVVPNPKLRDHMDNPGFFYKNNLMAKRSASDFNNLPNRVKYL